MQQECVELEVYDPSESTTLESKNHWNMLVNVSMSTTSGLSNDQDMVVVRLVKMSHENHESHEAGRTNIPSLVKDDACQVVVTCSKPESEGIDVTRLKTPMQVRPRCWRMEVLHHMDNHERIPPCLDVLAVQCNLGLVVRQSECVARLAFCVCCC